MSLTTVAQAAAHYQVSRQAVYAQLAKLPNKGKDRKTGLLTDDAVQLLDNVYQAKGQLSIKMCQVDLQVDIDALQGKNDALTVEVDRYKAQVAAMQEEINRLNALLDDQKHANEAMAAQITSTKTMLDMVTGERDFLRVQLDKAIVPALPAGEQKKSAAGFLAWLRGGMKKG